MITDHEWERISNEIEKREGGRKKRSFFLISGDQTEK